MAKLRFALNTWSWGYRINGSKSHGTGFLVVGEDNSVSVKTLLKTEFLFELAGVKETSVDGKEMKVIAEDGTTIELRAGEDDLRSLKRLIDASSSKKSAA